MARSVVIEPDIRDILASVEWDGNKARLTCGQLDRKSYVRVNDALESLGGKWDKKSKSHVFADDAQDELESLIETGVFHRAADLKQEFGEFFTPDWLAEELIEAAELFPDCTLLEPSAGNGNLVRWALSKCAARITAVEIQGKHIAALEPHCQAYNIDFLKFLPPHGNFDRVVMNPPFAKQADIDHVTRAFAMLVPGGRLAAIMSPGWTFRTNAKSETFKSLVDEWGTWREVEGGAFKCVGTNIATVLVTLDKERE